MFTYAKRIGVFMVAVTGLVAQTATSVPTTDTRTSGVVGIAEGQIARFNVLNPGTAVSATAAATCVAVLNYYDGAGTLLKTATVPIAPGKIGYLDLFSDADLALAADQRKQIRATLSVPLIPPPATSTTATPLPACQLIGTLEIFDSLTGRTSVVVGMHPVKTEVATPATN